MTLLIVEYPLVELIDETTEGLAGVEAGGSHGDETRKRESLEGHVQLEAEGAELWSNHGAGPSQRWYDFFQQGLCDIVSRFHGMDRQEEQFLQVNELWDDMRS